MLFGQVIRPVFLTPGPKQSKISKDSQMPNSNLLKQKSKLSMRPKKNYWASIQTKSAPSKNRKITSETIVIPSISVDAACAGNPGVLEYQGVNTETKEVLFFRGPFPLGTVNLGEFLAIVHGLAYLKKNNCPFPIYSDSRTAISWVKKKAIKTNLERNSTTEELFKMVDSALEWLHKNLYATKILKWETEDWGENPADYGRK